MRVFQILLGIFVMLLLAAMLWVNQVDWEKFRPELTAQISNALGAEVSIQGRLAITFFPFPQLSAQDVTVSANGLWIAAPRLRLAARLWPLLRGRVILSRAEIKDPAIRLEPEVWQKNAAVLDSAGNAKVQLQDVEIQNGTLEIIVGGVMERMAKIDLHLRAPDWHGPYETRGEFVWRDMEWSLASQIGVKTHAGNRPASLSIKQTGGAHQFAWRGAVRAVPLSMQGDGEWESVNARFFVKAEVNLANNQIEILDGHATVDDQEAGQVSGAFSATQRSWKSFSASLDRVPFEILVPLLGRQSPDWLGKIGPVDTSAIQWSNGILQSFKLSSPVLDVVFRGGRWQIRGPSAAAALTILGLDASTAQTEWSKPFELKMADLPNGVRIENFRMGAVQARGILRGQKLDLWAASAAWPSAILLQNLRQVLRQSGIETLNMNVRQWQLAPLAVGEGRLTWTSSGGDEHWVFDWPHVRVAGDYRSDNFIGEMKCDNLPMLELLRMPCKNAHVAGKGAQWQVIGQIENAHPELPPWQANINLDSGTWNLQLPWASGMVSGNGQLGQAEWDMTLDSLALQTIVPHFLSAVTGAQGEFFGQLHVAPDRAFGEVTLTNLQLPALNLAADNPAQPGKILKLLAQIMLQNNVLSLENIRTTTPDGVGQAGADLASETWHANWADARGDRVELDGPIATTVAEKFSTTNAPQRP